jgi:hypothetical protein
VDLAVDGPGVMGTDPAGPQ